MRRTSVTNDLYYLTLTVVGWIDIFTRPVYKQFIIDNLAHCQEHKGLEVSAYVLMTNHLHLIASINKGTISDWLRDFKSFTSKRLYRLIENNNEESRKEWMLNLFRAYGQNNELNKDFQIWQNGSHPVILYGTRPDIIKQKTDYIHNNPVRAGIVPEPHMYLYSSAHPLNPLGVIV